MLKTAYLIFGTAAALYGAFKLNHALRFNGEFDTYVLGLLFVINGSMLLWRALHKEVER
jgi:hypothetical protein